MKKRKKSIKSDLKKIDKLTDDKVDYSDILPLDDSFFVKTTIELLLKKEAAS